MSITTFISSHHHHDFDIQLGSLPFLEMKKGITDWMLNPEVKNSLIILLIIILLIIIITTAASHCCQQQLHHSHQQVTQHPIATVYLGAKPTFIINDLKLAKVKVET